MVKLRRASRRYGPWAGALGLGAPAQTHPRIARARAAVDARLACPVGGNWNWNYSGLRLPALPCLALSADLISTGSPAGCMRTDVTSATHPSASPVHASPLHPSEGRRAGGLPANTRRLWPVRSPGDHRPGVLDATQKIPRSGRSKSSSEEPENPRAELILIRYRQVRNPASSQIGVGKAEVSDQPANLALVAEHPAIEPGFYRHPCMPRAGKGHRSPPLVCRPSALDLGQRPPHLT